jgi:hypothetical protein
VRSSHDLFQRQQFFALEAGGIMSGLRTISAVFAATAGLDAKQAAPLDFFAAPMLNMNSPALRYQVEQGLMVKRSELTNLHSAVMLSDGMTNDECLMTKSESRVKLAERRFGHLRISTSFVIPSVHPLVGL